MGAVAVGAVAVHQQHVPVSDREEVGAGRVLRLQRPLAARPVEGSLVLPADQVGRGEQAGAVALVAGAAVLVADQRTVGPLLVPAGGVEHDVLVVLPVQRDDRVLRQLPPLDQVVVLRHGDAGALSGNVIDQGRARRVLDRPAAVDAHRRGSVRLRPDGPAAAVRKW